MSHIIFAEPAEQLNGPPRPSDLLNGLLPGDQLLAVNGINVNTLKREELLKLIKEADESIELTVQVVPELAELAGRSHGQEGHLQLNSLLMDSHDKEEIPEEQRYWLIHSNGYTMVKYLSTLSDGTIKIVINGMEMIVDAADLDKANPRISDRSNDISALKHLNETSAIHLLRNRHGSSLQYTNAGPRSLIYINNEKHDYQSLNLDLLKMFKGCRRSQMPAHVYSTAQNIYRNLQVTGKGQSVVFTGVSGSGKSVQLRSFVEFITGTAGWTKAITCKLKKVIELLEPVFYIKKFIVFCCR